MELKENIIRIRKELLEGVEKWIRVKTKDKTIDEREYLFRLSSLLDVLNMPQICTLKKESFNDEVDKLLRGYATYVSSQENFLYNPSYLYERIDEYWNVIKSINAHLDAVCGHFLVLQTKVGMVLKTYTLEYNDFYVMRYKKNHWEYSIHYSDFKKMMLYNVPHFLESLQD